MLGSLLQLTLSALLPLRWAAVPALVLLFNAAITTVFQCLNSSGNHFMARVVSGRATAQFPSEVGTYGPEPSQGSLVVFNLGIQFNHPLGVMAPGVKEINNAFLAMSVDMMKRKDELGLISVSHWRANERESNNSMLISYYFKDAEKIQQFANEELHLGARNAYYARRPEHVGIYHETFVVKDGGYESLYGNCHPVLMGRGQVMVNPKEGEKQWMSTLVSADTPALKSYNARLGHNLANSSRDATPAYGAV